MSPITSPFVIAVHDEILREDWCWPYGMSYRKA